MTISERTISILRNNFLMVLSLAFTALPVLLFSLFLAVKYLITLITEDAFRFFLEVWIWLGMFFLLVAIAYRRIKRGKSYPFLLVFSLFSFQSFFALGVKYAMPPIFLFVLLYNLFRLYRYPGEKIEHKGDEGAGG
jgi:hypothetical protein